MRFSTEARLSILRLPLDSWNRNESGRGFRSLFWISVGSTHRTRWTLIVNVINCLKKVTFLQMASNIGKLYIVRKNFLSRVWIRDRHLKIRLCLAQINLQSFNFCTEIRADDPSTFFVNERYHFEEEVKRNLLAPSLAIRIGRKPLFHCCEEMVAIHTHDPP